MPLKPVLEARLAELASATPTAAAEPLLRGYGGEILTFLASMLEDSDAADEAFAMFSVDVWRGIETFRQECSFRTWSYQLARHAACRLRRGEGRRVRRFEMDHANEAEKIAWEVRTTTAPFRRTSVKDAVRALRDELSDDDRDLIALRIDRGLEFADIAVILDADAATLRKRFERAKDRLRVKAQRAGLIR